MPSSLCLPEVDMVPSSQCLPEVDTMPSLLCLSEVDMVPSSLCLFQEDTFVPGAGITSCNPNACSVTPSLRRCSNRSRACGIVGGWPVGTHHRTVAASP